MYLLPDLFRLDRMRLRRFERTDPGPHYGDGLVEVIPDDTTVASVEKGEDGAVTVSLQDSMFEQGEQVPTESPKPSC